MKALRLFKALSMVDEDLVEEAWAYRPPARKRRPALYGLAAAACCTLFCAFGFFYLVTGGFHGFGSAAPEESPAESTAEGAEVSEDVADNGSDSVSYLSYAGPVLPLTVLEQDTSVTAAREVTWDVSSDAGQARYEDAYTLTNPTAQAITVTALYPFAGNFRNLSNQQPTLTVDGETVTVQLHPGA